MPRAAEVAVRATSVDVISTFPGRPEAMSSARRFVRGYLRGPRVQDLEIIASELITNSVRYAPADDGGEFIVRVRTGRCWARVEVSDGGLVCWRHPEKIWPDDEIGREMVVVAALADRFGRDTTAKGQTCWAETYWTDARGYGYMQLLAGQRPPDLAEQLRKISSKPPPRPCVPACALGRGLMAGPEAG